MINMIARLRATDRQVKIIGMTKMSKSKKKFQWDNRDGVSLQGTTTIF